MSEADRTLTMFLAAYGATGVALFVAMFLGHKGKVNPHIIMILVFLVGFVVTIYFADATGRLYKFDETRKAVHMPLAYTATAMTLFPLLTGILHWRKKAPLLAHKVGIAVFLVTFVAASATGGFMLMSRH